MTDNSEFFINNKGENILDQRTFLDLKIILVYCILLI